MNPPKPARLSFQSEATWQASFDAGLKGVTQNSDILSEFADLVAKYSRIQAEFAQGQAQATGEQVNWLEQLIALHQTKTQQLQKMQRDQDRDNRRLADLKKAEDRMETKWADGGEGAQPVEYTVNVGLSDDEKREQSDLGKTLQKRAFEIESLRLSIKEDAEADAQDQADKARAQEAERTARERSDAEQKKAAADQASAQQRETAAKQKQARTEQAAVVKASQLKQDTKAIHDLVRMGKGEVDHWDQQIALSDKNAALSDGEKYAKRVEYLKEQAAAIASVKDELIHYNPAQKDLDEVNGKVIETALDGFQQKRNKIEVDRLPSATRTQTNDKALRDLNDPAKHYQSAGEGLAGGVASWVADMGTLGDQMAASIKNTLGSAVKGITSEILKWDGTGKGALRAIGNIGQMIFRGMIEQIVQMAVQWGVTQLLIKTGLISTHVLGETLKGQEAASTVAKEGIKTPVLATNAGLASVSSFGVAAILGIALLIAGIAALAFDTGGYTPGGDRQKPVGIVHAGEWVAPQWLVNHPVYGPQIAALEGARSGIPGYDVGGFVNDLALAPAVGMTRPGYIPVGRNVGDAGTAGGGAGHRPVNVYPLMADDRGSIERAQRDPYSDAHFVHMLKKHRRVIGVKG